MVIMNEYHTYPIRIYSFTTHGKKVEKNLKLPRTRTFPSFDVSDF